MVIGEEETLIDNTNTEHLQNRTEKKKHINIRTDNTTKLDYSSKIIFINMMLIFINMIILRYLEVSMPYT